MVIINFAINHASRLAATLTYSVGGCLKLIEIVIIINRARGARDTGALLLISRWVFCPTRLALLLLHRRRNFLFTTHRRSDTVRGIGIIF